MHSNLLADAICQPVSVEGPKIKMSVLKKPLTTRSHWCLSMVECKRKSHPS